MKFKIVGDSCTDFLPEDRAKEYTVTVPLTIEVGDDEVIDDDSFNQSDFLRKIADYEGCPKSACPSPEAYMKSFEDAEEVYVVTLSSGLSGSYNSAELAKATYLESHPDVKIHVFDSKSASSGQLLIARLIEKYALSGMAFEEIVEKVTAFRDELHTTFVLDDLETLRKNGRLTGVKAVVANALNIKPYLKVEDGTIQQIGQARGMRKALDKMVDYIGEVGTNLSDKVVIISHCNCMDRAKDVERKLLGKYGFKDSIIIDTKGISTMYANDGGVIVSF
ncbi:MAG: DegV family protein [Lachnospiraceae bacterium]|nr:DegV family protein [Lachnospiraceae bacterium]